MMRLKNIDPKTAARVWERVQAPAPSAEAPALLNLIAEELLDAMTYQRLAKKLPPAQATAARQLSQQEQAHAACLKGIYTMLTGTAPSLPVPVIGEEPPQVTLRRCYGREMRMLSQYEARQTDPQYGHIFRRLSQEEQTHCHKLLEILGALGK